jgi:hypothetical protein
MTEVGCANLALIFLKVETIDSLNEDSQAAVLCKEYLQTCIDDALTEMHHFSFSIKSVTLTTGLDATYRDWTYLYPIPADLLQPVEFVDLENEDWEVVADGIATNKNPLQIIYMKRMTRISELPSLFARAVAYRLAMTVGPILSPSQGQELAGAVSLYERYLKEAANFDGRRNRISVKGSYTLLED